MTERHIKVVFFDGEPVVYDDSKQLDEKEIVELMVEYMEENAQLHKEIIDLKVYTEQLNSRIDHLKVKMDRERNATTKQHEKWDKEAQEKINELEKENKTLLNQLNNFKLHSKDLEKENKLLKQAVREELEDNGNRHSIIILNELFDLNYWDWKNDKIKYTDWEKELELKQLSDLYE